MPVTVVTRTLGSIGTVKSDAQAVTDETKQLSAAQYNTLADAFIETQEFANALEGRIEDLEARPTTIAERSLSVQRDIDVPTGGAVDFVIGGDVFNPTLFSGVFKLVGLGAVIGSSGATITIKLVDIGTTSTPAAGIVRATQTITSNAGPTFVSTTLTPTASPNVNDGTIFNSERVYELRVSLSSSTVGDVARLYFNKLNITYP